MNQDPLLIVEDSDDDFYAIRRALGEMHSRPLVRCRTGSEALDYIFQRGAYREAARPALILLDLNLPGTHGRTVLMELKADPSLRAIPVVIVSSSSNPQEINDCYRLGCGGYLTKMLSYKEFAPALQRLYTYWFQTVRLPSAPGSV